MVRAFFFYFGAVTAVFFVKENIMDFAMFEKFANNCGSEEGVAARFYDRAVKTGEVGENGLP